VQHLHVNTVPGGKGGRGTRKKGKKSSVVRPERKKKDSKNVAWAFSKSCEIKKKAAPCPITTEKREKDPQPPAPLLLWAPLQGGGRNKEEREKGPFLSSCFLLQFGPRGKRGLEKRKKGCRPSRPCLHLLSCRRGKGKEGPEKKEEERDRLPLNSTGWRTGLKGKKRRKRGEPNDA